MTKPDDTRPAAEVVDETISLLWTEAFNNTPAYGTRQYGHRKTKAIAEARTVLLAVIAREQRAARIDELRKLDTRRHYGKDYQDSLDELDDYKDKRITELERLQGGSVTTLCGFYAVNRRHCVIVDRCVVCKETI